MSSKFIPWIEEKKCPPIVPALVLLVVVLVTYANSFPGAFIQDDFSIVVENQLVTGFDVPGIFQSDYFGVGENSGLYRPLTVFSLGLNYLLFGEQPWGFHLVNVLLHGGVALLLWQALRLWKVAAPVAWLSALLFAVHPIHTEVVNQAVGRGELQVALFLLLALCASRKEGAAGATLTVVSYLLALLSKEHAIVFLALLPVMDSFLLGPSKAFCKRWRLYAVLALVTATWLAWWQWGVPRLVQPDAYDPVYVFMAYLPDGARVFTTLKLQGLYLAKMLLPYGLQGVYSGPGFPGFVMNPWSLSGIAIVVVSALLFLLGWFGWRRREVWALGLVLYVISFLPTSNILFPIGVSFAERLTYLPSLWFCVGLSSLLFALRRWQRPVFYGFLFYAVVLGTLSVDRNRAFASETRLWQTDIERSETNVLAWVTLAGAQKRTSPLQAEQTFEKMLEVMPDDYAEAWHSWGLYLARNHRFEEALVSTKRAELLWSASSDPRADYSRGLLAFLYLENDDFSRALYWLDRGARFANNEDRIFELRGRALSGLGEHEQAIESFSRMKIVDPGSGIPFHFGMSLLQVGRLDEATPWLEREVSEQESAPAWNGLGVALAQQHRTVGATEAFQRAVELAPENLSYQQNLQRAMRDKEQKSR
jgi:tetratricopeptide (TPR) repeat protein